MADDKFWRKPRKITRRIIVKGDLVLHSAAHFGGGTVDPFGNVDMTLLRDPLEGTALLPGASIAGALRSYLGARDLGYHKKETSGSLPVALFGMRKMDNRKDSDPDTWQSQLIVHDSLATVEPGVEFRDGVKIDPKTRTAVPQAKYDLEVLAAGTTFPLTFELVIEADNDADVLKQALAAALQGLETGEIHLGARKNRGLGRVKVEQWKVMDFDLTSKAGLLSWLTVEQPGSLAKPQTGSKIAPLLTVDPDIDQRHTFSIKATFALDDALLVRSAFGYGSTAADTVQLQAKQADGSVQPVIPGSSFAGVIRHRALRIAKALGLTNADVLVNQMFGYHQERDVNKPESKAHMTPSRVRVRDAVVTNTRPMVQNRIRIDRFTGGAHETALFAEQPVFGQGDSQTTLDLVVINPNDEEIGLLLQVLKDLWVSDLAVGGASSVGRGRLRGVQASLIYKEGDDLPSKTWELVQPTPDAALKITGERATLEGFAQALAAKGEDA